jgi:hypothetical protein
LIPSQAAKGMYQFLFFKEFGSKKCFVFFLTKNKVEINVEITDNAVCENENILNFLVFIINKIELHHWGNG